MLTAAKPETPLAPPPIHVFEANGFGFSFSNLAQNSHRGYRLSTAVPHQGFEPVISNTATSFGTLAYDFRVRPRSTGKERDAETGLDYFGARYMSSAQGRFTSPDPIHIMLQKLLDPQQWNMYSYVRNNPLRLVDPTGMYTTDCAQDDKKCNKLIDKFEKARQKDLKSKNENVRNGAGSFGARGDDNGVVVHVVTGQQMQQSIGVTANGAVVPTPGPLPGQGDERLDVYINKDLGGSDLQRTIAHEGTHVGDDLSFINSFNPDTGMYSQAFNVTHGQTEFNAFTAGAGVKKYDYSNVQCGNGPCIFGPQDAAKINQFLHNSPTYGPVFNVPVFDPRRWPQQ